MAVNIARYHQANAQAFRASGERAKQRPALQLGTGWVGAKWNEVVKGPGVFNGRNAISFLPDAKYIIVSGELRCRFDTKSEVGPGGHIVFSFKMYVVSAA